MDGGIFLIVACEIEFAVWCTKLKGQGLEILIDSLIIYFDCIEIVPSSIMVSLFLNDCRFAGVPFVLGIM